MAPHPGVDTEQIKENAGKDLLDLLVGVCKGDRSFFYSKLLTDYRLEERRI
jgi:hypothetical protein